MVKVTVMFSVKSARVRDMHIETHSALNFFQHNFLVEFWCRRVSGVKEDMCRRGKWKNFLRLTRGDLLLPVNTRGKGVPKGRGL